MMKINNINEKQNKIILKASAGTGKTYRLSLEYIANLIKGVNYKNIVVMTFTKKATAEIKERIYDFLYQIAFEKYNWKELENSLKELYGFSDDEILKNNLQNMYFEMIKNKDEIRIYTIDGFTNRIFKNTIAPYFGVYSYETIDEEEDEFYNDILIKIKELRVAQEQAYNTLFRYHNNLADSLNKQFIADMLDYICGWCDPEKYIWGNREK